MNNEQAYKKLTPDGEWEIRFDPNEKMGGLRWNVLRGFIDEEKAQMIVDLLNSRKW